MQRSHTLELLACSHEQTFEHVQAFKHNIIPEAAPKLSIIACQGLDVSDTRSATSLPSLLFETAAAATGRTVSSAAFVPAHFKRIKQAIAFSSIMVLINEELPSGCLTTASGSAS
jgi:hypothetical protein